MEPGQSPAEEQMEGEPASAAAPQQGSQPGKGNPQIKAEFERGATAVGKVLYQDSAMSDKILGMINEKEKVGSVAQAAVMTVTQIDKKLDLAERVIPALTIFTTDRVLELATEMGIQFSDEEKKQAAMSAMELALTGYGVPQERAAQLAQSRSPDELKAAESVYKGVGQNV